MPAVAAETIPPLVVLRSAAETLEMVRLVVEAVPMKAVPSTVSAVVVAYAKCEVEDALRPRVNLTTVEVDAPVVMP